MNGPMLRRTIIVTAPQGLHMRPLSLFAQMAAKFKSSVTVSKQGKPVNGKSPLELLLLAAEQGSELTLEVCGDDAAAAMEALAPLLEAPEIPDAKDEAVPKKG